MSYPDIEPLLRSLDVPTNPHAGQATYTLPAVAVSSSPISSSSTPPNADLKTINQSFPIADELERKFPDSTTIFPTGVASRSLALLVDSLLVALRPVASPCIHPYIPDILDPRGRDHFHATKPEKVVPPSDPDAAWDKLAQGLQVFVDILSQDGRTGVFLEGKGETFGYADAVLVAFMGWYERGNKPVWDKMVALGDGQLGKLFEACRGWVEGQGETREWDWEQKNKGKASSGAKDA